VGLLRQNHQNLDFLYRFTSKGQIPWTSFMKFSMGSERFARSRFLNFNVVGSEIWLMTLKIVKILNFYFLI